MPQGTNRIWYLTVILSHNNLFVPHWHYTLIYGLPVQNVTFLSETKYTWIVHFTWPTIYLFTLYDRFEFKILITIYIIERYLISKIPSTVIWYRFQQDITYRDLFIFHYFRYLNLFQDFMKCYVNVLFYSTCLIIMTILIICSFLLQGILYLESIGLLRFRRIIDSVLQGLHIGAFAAELYHRVSAFIWQLICNIMQMNYPLNFKFTYLFNEDLDNS